MVVPTGDKMKEVILKLLHVESIVEERAERRLVEEEKEQLASSMQRIKKVRQKLSRIAEEIGREEPQFREVLGPILEEEEESPHD